MGFSILVVVFVLGLHRELVLHHVGVGLVSTRNRLLGLSHLLILIIRIRGGVDGPGLLLRTSVLGVQGGLAPLNKLSDGFSWRGNCMKETAYQFTQRLTLLLLGNVGNLISMGSD